MSHFPDVPVGYEPSARDWNAMLDEIERLGRMSATPPLKVDPLDPAGPAWSIDYRSIIWIKLTSAGTGGNAGKYAWTRVYPLTGGTWQTSTFPNDSGTVTSDPAIETNLNPSLLVSVSTLIVRAWRCPQSNDLRFEASAC